MGKSPQPPLSVVDTPSKGRGIVVDEAVAEGVYVLEYEGDV